MALARSKATNRRITHAQPSSPRTDSTSAIAENSQEQKEAYAAFWVGMKQEWEKKVNKATDKEIAEYKKKTGEIIKRHNHMIKTHAEETTEAYTKIVRQLEPVDSEIDKYKKELADLLQRKQDLVATLVAQTKELFEETDEMVEGCVQALEDIVLGISARPAQKTEGLIGKHLEGDVQDEIRSIKNKEEANEQVGEQDQDDDAMEED
ncbi:hypothetical protein FFLO_06666 [Filobasidium floriforme]|uniref:Uncharacterized protein n=1 Tax=Filobasidium floriforme TaxID=5210 RepID=A0A8K0JEX8_9TREE|nr:uncharacterized protein HD553DRAFT_151350 [Filobasidium floriforme]KAG7527699.1 hypothetical protein FFLO_06666 [Filobasidium floriforme]KAH8077971.1 hypothetical protein HD553DRAFT_151350 [Filobasidium floriforme]